MIDSDSWASESELPPKVKSKGRPRILTDEEREQRKEQQRIYQRDWQRAKRLRPGIREQQRKYQRNYKHTDRAKSATFKRKYGISLEQWQEMYDEQNGICAIGSCNRSVTDVDHDHLTGRVRALLCHTCNLRLGQFGDDPEKLEESAAYIRRFRVTGAA